jgi:hypothetical protein
MMVLLLLYAWVGSAGVPAWSRGGFTFWFVRQEFEKTEMEWFNWWPFHLLLILLAVSLVLVTVRRIKLNMPNLGVWMVHVGILILMLGCVMYFGQKIEGDMAVYRRQAVINVPGGSATLILRPGEQTVVRGDDRSYSIRVANLNPDYELLTGADRGKKTYAAQLMFTPVGATEQRRPFIRQLLVGYPEYTEDVVPGEGRAVKVIGRPLVDESVSAELAHVPTTTIHLVSDRALYARLQGAEEWAEMPLRGLPRYREHGSPSTDVLTASGMPAPPLPLLDLERPWKSGHEALPAGTRVRVTGYLPFARLIDRWAPGGSRFAPYVRFAASVPAAEGATTFQQELLATVPGRSRSKIGEDSLPTSFKWVETEEQLARWLEPGEPQLRVSIPERGISRAIPLASAQEAPVAVGGYTVQLLELYPSWTLARTGELVSMALVRVEGPSGGFRRAVVYPRAELTQDLDDSGARHQGLIDDSINVELESLPESGLMIIGGPVGLHVLLVNRGGEVMHEPAELGRPVTFLDGQLTVTVEQLSETARFTQQPILIPERERDLKAGSFYSIIRAEVSNGEWRESVWIPYSHYSHPSVLGFHTPAATLPDGRRLELLYSRERYQLDHAVVLEEFQLETYPGRQRERDYISLVRFLDDGEYTETQEVRSNQPSEHDGWWFFQATWDPPRPRMGHAGMNYTGLGVGNRHGVLVMLLGSALTVIGTVYAFYYKPVLLRRIRDRARERAAAASDERSRQKRAAVATATAAPGDDR